VVALAGGVLAGKYTRKDIEADIRQGKKCPAKNAKGKNQPVQKQQHADDEMPSRKGFAVAMGNLSPRGLDITDAVKKPWRPRPAIRRRRWRSAGCSSSPASPARSSAQRTLKQLEDNLAALEVELTRDQIGFLSRASAIENGFPHDFLPARHGAPVCRRRHRHRAPAIRERPGRQGHIHRLTEAAE